MIMMKKGALKNTITMNQFSGIDDNKEINK